MAYDINFLKTESELRSYFLGLFMADGWIDNKNGVYISVCDKQIIDDLVRATNYTNTITHIIKKNNFGKQNMYRIGYQKLNIEMRELGFNESKTGNEFIPTKIENTFNHFLRGLSDGDGSFYYSERKSGNYLSWELISASEEFLKNIEFKIKDHIGINNNIKVHPRQGTKMPVFRIRCNQNNVTMKLADFMYKNCNLKLKRKYDIVKSATRTIYHPGCHDDQ